MAWLRGKDAIRESYNYQLGKGQQKGSEVGGMLQIMVKAQS
jgi:hypothetical protein